MDSFIQLEDQIWEAREHTAQMELDLIRTQRRLRLLEEQFRTANQTGQLSLLVAQPSENGTNGSTVHLAPSAERIAVAAAPPQRSSAVPDLDLKPLPMPERMQVVRTYAERFSKQYSQKVIAAALHISTATYNNMLAGRGTYAKYA